LLTSGKSATIGDRGRYPDAAPDNSRGRCPPTWAGARRPHRWRPGAVPGCLVPADPCRAPGCRRRGSAARSLCAPSPRCVGPAPGALIAARRRRTDCAARPRRRPGAGIGSPSRRPRARCALA